MAEPPIKKTKSAETSPSNNMIKRRRQYLEVGQKGFLASCNVRDKLCVRDCYAILNKFATDMYGKEPEPAKLGMQDGLDITDKLDQEIDAVHASMNQGRPRRFQAVYTGIKKSIFIKTTLDDPVALSKKIITELAENRIKTTRFIERLVPVEIVCQANLKDITKAAQKLVDKYFSGEPKTFSIVSKRRCNKDLDRTSLITALATLITEKNPEHKVDLMKPELSLIAEVIRGKCCMSVVEKYKKYLRYNLIKLYEGADAEEHGEEENANEDAEEDNLGETDDLDTYQDYSEYDLQDIQTGGANEKDGCEASSVKNGDKDDASIEKKNKKNDNGEKEDDAAEDKADNEPMDTDAQQEKNSNEYPKVDDGKKKADNVKQDGDKKKAGEAKNKTAPDATKPPGEEPTARVEMPAHSKLKELLERPSVKKYKEPIPSPDKK